MDRDDQENMLVLAGERIPDGSFEPETINARVDQHLCQMAETLQRYGKEDGHKQETEQNNNAG
jgi:hypothetical protein